MLSTLSHLSSLLKKEESAIESVTEAKTRDASADFDGIKSVVTDNFADLEDCLGKGGKLLSLLKETGVDKLDTEKDAAGKTMMDRLAAAVMMMAKAKKDVMKAMDEMELMVASAAPAKMESIEDEASVDDNA
jgi:hypothetical protein